MRFLSRLRFESGNDLRQLDQLFHCLPFRNSLRTEGDVNLAIQRLNSTVHQPRHPRINGAPQNKQRPVSYVLQQSVNISIGKVHRRIKVLVDRSAHNCDNNVRSSEAS